MKRQTISKDVREVINSFNLKPREFYDLIHGKKVRYAAYELCLYLILDAGESARKSLWYKGDLRLQIAWDVEELVVKMKRVGVVFPNHKIIYKRELTTWQIKEISDEHMGNMPTWKTMEILRRINDEFTYFMP